MCVCVCVGVCALNSWNFGDDDMVSEWLTDQEISFHVFSRMLWLWLIFLFRFVGGIE